VTILTARGTTFRAEGGTLTITRGDQPECTIPMADLEEFVRLYYDAGKDDSDDDFEEDESLE
jgi:hypothetical protein